MPGGYRLEMTVNKRRACNGPQPCKGTKLDKEIAVFGTWVPFEDKGSFKWRHLGCLTAKVLKNVKADFEDPAEVDGFDDLPQFWREKFTKYMEDGKVPDEDIPETARKPVAEDDGDEEDEEGKPKKKKKAAKKKAKDATDGEEEEAKPKKATKRKAKAASDEEEEDAKPKKKAKRKSKADDEDDEEEEIKPKKRASRKKAKEEDDDEEEEVMPKAKTARGKAKSEKDAYLASKYMSGAKADAILARDDEPSGKKKRKSGKGKSDGLAVVDQDEEELVWEASDAENDDAPSK